MHRQAALPLLQFTLREFWRARDRNRITWDCYKDLGGDPLVVLANSAKAFLDQHKDLQTLDEIKRILLELVRVDDRLEPYRQPVARSRLLAEGKANSPAVLKLLEEADFVRVTPSLAGDDAVVEVKHKSLIRNWPELVTWIDEKRVRYRQRLALTDAASQWAKSRDRSKGLLTGSLLENAKRQPNLSDVEKDYIKASDEAENHERLKFQKLYEKLKFRFALAIALGACALCLLISVVYLLRANERKQIAIANQKVELANQQRANFDQQARLAYQETRISSQKALLADERAWRMKEAADRMKEVADQRLRSGIALLIESRKAPPDLELLLALEYARLGREVADPFTLLMDVQTEDPELDSILGGQSGSLRAVKFSPHGKFIASGSDDGTIALRDAEGRLLRAPWSAYREGAVYSIAFTSDEKTLASAGDDCQAMGSGQLDVRRCSTGCSSK